MVASMLGLNLDEEVGELGDPPTFRSQFEVTR
jgi:hypothetical protein